MGIVPRKCLYLKAERRWIVRKVFALGLLAIVALTSAAHAQSAGYTDNGYYNGDFGRSTMLPGSQRREASIGISIGAKLGLSKQRQPDNCCGHNDEPFVQAGPRQGAVLDPQGFEPLHPEPNLSSQAEPTHGKGCGGKGKWCLVPETCVVKVLSSKCVERTVCCPQLTIGPCGIGLQSVERQVAMRVPTLVEKEVTRWRWHHEKCTCDNKR